MSRTTSQNILLTVSNPPAGNLPAWAAAIAPGHWGPIPNSTPIGGAGYYLQQFGYPALVNNQFRWGANKYGADFFGSTYDPMGASLRRANYSGMAVDRRNSTVWIGGGDSGWGDPSYHAFELEHDSGAVCRVAAISGVDNPPQGGSYDPTHMGLYLKKPMTYPGPNNPYVYPTTVAPDDGRFERNYDGSHRGGHTYWCQQFIESRNYICHFGAFQFYPTDTGNSDNVVVADIVAGKWKYVEEIPAPGFGGMGQLIAQQIVKDYITEDVYIWRTVNSPKMMRWKWNVGSSGGVWQVLYTFTGLGGIFGSIGVQNLAMCVHPIDHYVLCMGQIGSTPAGVVRFLIDLTKTDAGQLAKYTPVILTGNASDVAVTYSASTNTVTMAEARPIADNAAVRFYGPNVSISGQPDIQAGMVYRWVRTGATTGTLNRRQAGDLSPLIPVTITSNGSGTMTRMNFSNAHPIEWCPDIEGGSMIGFQDDQMLLNFTRGGVSGASALINVDEYPTTGIPGFRNANQDSASHAGGILTGFKYMPRLRGFVYFPDDLVPMQYLRIF